MALHEISGIFYGSGLYGYSIGVINSLQLELKIPSKKS